ncbi:MAG: hypothetical protein ACI4CT_09635 [Lachnospiraceae bacterium]
MWNNVWTQTWIGYVIAGIGIFSVLQKLILATHYRKLVFASGNIGISRQKLIRSLKSKVENNYEMNLKIHDVSSFVRKYFQDKKYLGITYTRWNQLHVQTLLLLGLLETAQLLILPATQNRAAGQTLLATVALGLVLTLIEEIMGNRNRFSEVMDNLENYIANFYQNKLEQQTEGTDRTIEQDMDYLKSCIGEIASTREDGSSGLSPKEAKIVEDILNEFFA